MKRLDEWLAYIESVHPRDMLLGLERVGQVYQSMGELPEVPVVTVAGTNGKGSTVRVLQALAKANGLRAGAYTSPHILRYNERVQIDLTPVTDEALVAAFTAIEQARGDTPLTYFEFGTLAALWIFAQANLDLVILEVGLGGRLDAVNIVDPDVAVITSIALDHQDWLGNTREAIGAEKAGILRKDGLFVCGDPAPPQSVIEAAQQCRSSLWQGVDFGYHEPDFWLQSPTGQNVRLACTKPLPLLPVNIASGCQAFAALGFELDQQMLVNAWPHMGLSGRQQIIQKNPTVIADVGHNPQAAEALAEHLVQRSGNDNNGVSRCFCVLGMLADKALADTLAPLLPVIDRWWPVGVDAGARSQRAEVLADALWQAGADVAGSFGNAHQGYRAALAAAQPHDVIVVFGSFYTVSDVLDKAQK